MDNRDLRLKISVRIVVQLFQKSVQLKVLRHLAVFVSHKIHFCVFLAIAHFPFTFLSGHLCSAIAANRSIWLRTVFQCQSECYALGFDLMCMDRVFGQRRDYFDRIFSHKHIYAPLSFIHADYVIDRVLFYSVVRVTSSLC